MLYPVDNFSMREEDFEAPLPHRHQEVQGCISAKTMWSNDSEWSNGCAVLILKAIVCHATTAKANAAPVCPGRSVWTFAQIERQAIANGGAVHVWQIKLSHQRSQVIKLACIAVVLTSNKVPGVETHLPLRNAQQAICSFDSVFTSQNISTI